MPPLLRNFPQQTHGLCCVTKVSISIGVNLFVNPVTQISRRFIVSTKSDRREMVDLNDPHFVIPVSVHSSVRVAEQDGCASPGRELAEYLLHNVAPLKAIPDVVEGELFQTRNVILNKCHPKPPKRRRNGRNLICEPIN